MTFFKTISLGLLGVLMTLAAQAQTPGQQPVPQQQPQATPAASDFSPEELRQFAQAAGRVMEIQAQSEQKMVAAIEQEDLEVDQFNQILTMQQQRATQEDVETPAEEPTAEEMAAFNKAAQQIMQIRQETDTEMVTAIEDEGLAPEKFQEIMMAYQQNPEVKQQIDAMLEGMN